MGINSFGIDLFNLIIKGEKIITLNTEKIINEKKKIQLGDSNENGNPNQYIRGIIF